ncbi:MAG: insulinase family protein [Treponema sp.]|jgi:zinc protease|nr:insulinase family protein [Treponema sp.]
MKNYFRFFGFILLSALVLTCVSAPRMDYAGLGKGDDLVPLTDRALTGTLPNGLKYFIIENSLPENRAHLALLVNAGSVLERDDERGYAHFVEHLAFSDTERFPKMQLIEYLRSLGMRFGADANAYTSYNETVYHFDVPVENTDGVKRIPERALAILDDWTYAVSFLPEDVASESLVILEEHRTRLGAMERVRKITLPMLFAGSAYENREPIGLVETIENATSESLRGFYSRWYTSDNMALVFVGDFDGKALQADLARHFNKPAAAAPVNRPVHELPPPKNGNFQVRIITDPELTSSSYMIYFKQKQGAPRGTLKFYRETILDYLIDTMLSLRFDEKSNDPDSAATSAWGGIWRWAANSRFYSMGSSPKTGSVEKALEELLLEKEAMRRFGFTASELERAKVSLVSYMEKQLSEKDRRESRLFVRNITSHFLYGEDMADIEWEMNAVNSLLPGIGIKEIADRARNYFANNDCIVFLIAPQAEAENLPTENRIREIFKETASARIQRRISESLSDELLDKLPESGSVKSEYTDKDTDATVLELSNGAKVILKETENKNNEIILYAMAKGGTNNASLEDLVSANMASEMTAVSGLGPYSRTELVNKLAGKQVSFSFWNSAYYRGFQGSSTVNDLKTFFEMLYLSFTNPRFDERAIDAMLDQYSTALANQNFNPQRVFSNEITRIITNNHPYYLPLELEDLEKVSIERAFDYLSGCLNPADYTFVFTGNLDINQMKEFSKKYIASIPNSASMNSWADPKITRPGKTEKSVYMGVDERCSVYLVWFASGPDSFDERKNQAAAVLSEYLDILLTDEIREKMSGVYSISPGASVSVIPKGEYRLNVYFQCSPERAEELIAAVEERIREIANSPINQDTFVKSKEALLMEHERALQRNLHIAQSYANSSVLYDTPLSRLNARPDAIRAVTAAEMQTLCRDMLAVGAVRVVLYPSTE